MQPDRCGFADHVHWRHDQDDVGDEGYVPWDDFAEHCGSLLVGVVPQMLFIAVRRTCRIRSMKPPDDWLRNEMSSSATSSVDDDGQAFPAAADAAMAVSHFSSRSGSKAVTVS